MPPNHHILQTGNCYTTGFSCPQALAWWLEVTSVPENFLVNKCDLDGSLSNLCLFSALVLHFGWQLCLLLSPGCCNLWVCIYTSQNIWPWVNLSQFAESPNSCTRPLGSISAFPASSDCLLHLWLYKSVHSEIILIWTFIPWNILYVKLIGGSCPSWPKECK